MTRIDFLHSEWGAAAASALLLILAFPNFEYYLLAWIALVPLLVVIARRPSPLRAFILGWAVGSVFFYVTCYWLTYSMIHYGGLPTALAYLLLVPGAVVIGIFHGLFALLVALTIQKWGRMTILLAPIFWTAFEWVRLGVTGQLWNALGYSQAYHASIIEPATWGGVYAVSFLVVAINSVVALLIVHRTALSIALALLIALAVGVPAGYGIARLRASRTLVLILIARMTPALSFLIPLFTVFQFLGLNNTLTALVITHLVITVPIVVYIIFILLVLIAAATSSREAFSADSVPWMTIDALRIVPSSITFCSYSAANSERNTTSVTS